MGDNIVVCVVFILKERAEEEQKKFRRKRRSVMSACTAVIEELHQAIVEQRNMEELEGLLWAGVLAYQGSASTKKPKRTTR